MTRSILSLIRCRGAAFLCRPLALVCCLLLTPADTLPLLETVFELSLTSKENTSSPQDDDEMFDSLDESTRLSRRELRAVCTAVVEVRSVGRSSYRRGPRHPALPGCEHGRRNGLGAPLRC